MSIWDDISRLLSGRNDAPPADPNLMTGDIFGGSKGWTEADYQNALRVWQQMDPREREYRGMTSPPPAPELNPGMANVNLQRGYFNPYVASLAQAAQGQGPSQAQNALREGTATTVATQFGAAATPAVGGAQRAALYANAMNNAAGAQQTGARQGAQLRAQEMTDARQQLGQALAQQQGTNLQAVGLGTEREKSNQQAGIGAAGINAQVGEQNRGGILDMWGKFWSDIRAKEDIQPLQTFRSTTDEGPGFQYVAPESGSPFAFKQYLADAPKAPAAPLQEQKKGFLGNLFSDERSKERITELEGALAESRRTADTISGANVEHPFQYGQGSRGALASSGPGGGVGVPTQSFVDLSPPTARFADLSTPRGSRQALGPVAPYEYRYKPEFAAATGEDTSPRAGIMAQDLERSPNPALRSAVIDTPMGKAIDGKRAVSANLALSAGLDKRLRNIESAMAQPTEYPNLLSDENSKETIRLLSEALVDKPKAQPAAFIPEGARLVTPPEESERKLGLAMRRVADPYASDRAAIESASMAPQPGVFRWQDDFMDPDNETLPGRGAPPRYY